MADIVIGGRLHSAATGNTVAGANEIMDDAQGKKQSVVNQELANRISEAGQQQQAAMEAEAETRAAKDRELKALIDQGIIEGGGIVFDTEPTPDSVNPVTSNGISGTLGYNTENVEFIRVLVDSQNRVVFGIQRDGNAYFGAGVPRQIQDYVRDMMATIDLSDITTTLAQITDYLTGKLGTQLTLSEELNGKVDKEDGKSLIDEDYAESISYDDSSEFIHIVTDRDGKVIAGIKADSTPWFNNIEVDGKAFYGVTDSPEWLVVWTDSDDRVLMGIRRDGSVYPAGGSDLTEIEAEIAEIQAMLEGVDWDAVKAETIFNDPEGRLEVTTDDDYKVLGWRDANGVRHEQMVKVEKKLELSEEAMTEFQQALKDAGFQPGGGGDWTDKAFIDIPEPKLAFVNITGINSMPTAKGTNAHAVFEVYDGVGNYFKKKCIVDLQGDSSSVQAKKNFAADFCEDDWEGDETTEIKIGSWVVQDSFHFKAYYTSMFKAECPISYKIWDMMRYTRGFDDDTPYKAYFAEGYGTTDAGIEDNLEQNVGTGARTVPDGFPCIVYLNGDFYGLFIWQLKKHRDNYFMDRNATDNIHIEGEMGFAEFWDGSIQWGNPGVEIRNPKPKSSKWTMLCQDGTKYDFDNGHWNIMTTRPANYDELDTKGKKNCDNSIKVAQNIQVLADFITNITPYETQYLNNEITLTEFKAEMEKRMSMSWLMDYILLVNFIQDSDSVRKNWQWTTWGKIDNVLKWFICPYDLDMCFGVDSTIAWPIGAPAATTYGQSLTANTPAYYIWKYYLTEMKARYAELREAKVFDYDTVFGLYTKWVERIGYANFEKEYDKWPDSPCNRDSGVSSKWERIGNAYLSYTPSVTTWRASTTYGLNTYTKYLNKCYRSKVANNIGHIPTDTTYWDDVMVKAGSYAVGDEVIDGKSNFYRFRAKEAVTVDSELNGRPFDTFYDDYPYEGGSRDSIYRIGHWIKEKIRLMDIQMEYNN